jgi:glutathione S-transferase
MTMSTRLTLVSHHLCPYVQRAVISLTEKGVPFERVYVDLANKPDWFKTLSPLGKTPVLKVGASAVFESAVILEYLEETHPIPLHPSDPLRRAEHRSLVEYGSSILNDIWGLYTAPDAAAFATKRAQLEARFAWLEARASPSPWFDGGPFSLVDTAFGPIFRYFDVFDAIDDFGILTGKEKLARWRAALAARPSIRHAVSADYAVRLWAFLKARKSHLSYLMSVAGRPPMGRAHT